MFCCIYGEGDSPEAVAVGSLEVVIEVLADIAELATFTSYLDIEKRWRGMGREEIDCGCEQLSINEYLSSSRPEENMNGVMRVKYHKFYTFVYITEDCFT